MDDDLNVPIPFPRTLFLVNTFIIHTVRLLNKFSAICEQKLGDIHQRILRLEATLTLLEAKLSNIDGIEIADGMQGSTMHPSFTDLATEGGQAKLEVMPTDESRSSLNLSIATDFCDEKEFLTTASLKSKQLQKAKDDPRYSRFFKMLHVGVPEMAVKLQMSLEGIDPSLLHD